MDPATMALAPSMQIAFISVSTAAVYVTYMVVASATAVAAGGTALKVLRSFLVTHLSWSLEVKPSALSVLLTPAQQRSVSQVGLLAVSPVPVVLQSAPSLPVAMAGTLAATMSLFSSVLKVVLVASVRV